MGYLYQASSSNVDTYLASISCWVRIPTVSWANNKSIFVGQWGPYVYNTTSQPTQLVVTIANPLTPIISWNGAGRPGQYSYGGESCTAAFTYMVGPVLASFIDQNKWFLLQGSANWGTGIFDTTNGTGLGTVRIVVNGTTISNILAKSSGVQRDRDFYTLNWSNFTQPFNMAFNVAPFGFPGAYPTITASASAECADFQMWIGTALDFSLPAVQAKFFTVSGGRGYPVNPSAAAAAFGTQTYLFKGKASDSTFFTNQGNGGAVTKIGTVSDFSPGPSF